MASSGGWKVASSSVPPLFLLMLVTFCIFVSVSSAYRVGVRNPMAAANRNQRQSNNQIPACNAMLLKSQCSQNPRCRWCRSDALDDMCFAKVEAWRLPPQVFSCN